MNLNDENSSYDFYIDFDEKEYLKSIIQQFKPLNKMNIKKKSRFFPENNNIPGSNSKLTYESPKNKMFNEIIQQNMIIIKDISENREEKEHESQVIKRFPYFEDVEIVNVDPEINNLSKSDFNSGSEGNANDCFLQTKESYILVGENAQAKISPFKEIMEFSINTPSKPQLIRPSLNFPKKIWSPQKDYSIDLVVKELNRIFQRKIKPRPEIIKKSLFEPGKNNQELKLTYAKVLSEVYKEGPEAILRKAHSKPRNYYRYLIHLQL